MYNFGLANGDINYKLEFFISNDTLSRLPLTNKQIIHYADRLNWQILSCKNLSGYILNRYADRIDWIAWIKNRQKKNIEDLQMVEEQFVNHLIEYPDLLDDVDKSIYYTDEFVCEFPHVVDFDWYVKNSTLSEHVILICWQYINHKLLYKYQKITKNIANEKIYEINWSYASKFGLSMDVIEAVPDQIDWRLVSQYSNLTEPFILKYIDRICPFAISKYQYLSEQFIINNQKRVSWFLISRYQMLSYEFIINNQKHLDISQLSNNLYFNKKNTIQIVNSKNRWYVVDSINNRCFQWNISV